ncbi:MAG: hypothetical protein APG12_00856 [Candidatus Methanofastidiosum methylothiophilum]|uniref:DUF2927 domain-containing protein n=1 Tax=Candidatus Methanofastidiosum methylothiophilum TaxID=1705564 RepID=A0A150IIF2_9EURY|nr:MAG: hypothetical protein APG10_01691 [Candidatus Methanofastidiosum methylthiophilus]KYC46961.1 MAG: hypothetical protein APG11_01556 [Candidatus Methanofastidiosum methylthiophilus]KYC50328.1 MAG: hypothetical protein APG12_00856 [Candidatus Methanofastidiosum methylthiophilus]
MIKKIIIFSLISIIFYPGCLFFEEGNNAPISTGNLNLRYTEREIEYFTEIALGTEYGGSTQVIRKWDSDIKIKINGNPTERDLQTLNLVISDINEIIGDKINLTIVNSNQNITINFVPISDFSICKATRGNYGYFNCKWRNNVIYECDICIATDDALFQEERSHMIREELTQSLGLMKDSLKYRDSIFYEGWTQTQGYSELDRKMIEILYSEDLRPGMRKFEVESVLRK